MVLHLSSVQTTYFPMQYLTGELSTTTVAITFYIANGVTLISISKLYHIFDKKFLFCALAYNLENLAI